MRGTDHQQSRMFSYISAEQHVADDDSAGALHGPQREAADGTWHGRKVIMVEPKSCPN